MKKQITFLGIILMMVAATALIAAGTQQDKGKGQQKEQQKGNDKADKAQKDQGKNDNKGQGNDKNDDKGNQGKNDNANQGQGKGNSDDKGQGKNDNGNSGNNGNGNNANANKGGNKDFTDGFKWDRETFKDRDKIRKQDKVTICHKFNNNNEPAVTLRVSSNALKAHMNHGDVQGECSIVNNSTFSDRFLKRRTDYYNELQEANEQVLYSQSVLDYAKMRLMQAQQQLASTQASQLPMAQIQQRQAVVTELEQNVSLLETLVGVAAQLVVNKLTN